MVNVLRHSDAATGAKDGDSDENTSSGSGSESGSGSSCSTAEEATAEEAAILERAKLVTGDWPVITTTEPPGDQSAGNAGCGSSDLLWDVLALCLVTVVVRVLNDRRPHMRPFAAMTLHEIVCILFPETFGQYGPGTSRRMTFSRMSPCGEYP